MIKVARLQCDRVHELASRGGRNSAFKSGSIEPLSLMAGAGGNSTGGRYDYGGGYETTKSPPSLDNLKRECAHLEAEMAAGYLAVILGLLQFVLVIPSIGPDNSVGWWCWRSIIAVSELL